MPESIVVKVKINELKMLGLKADDDRQLAEVEAESAQAELAVQTWCSTRYRSYNPSDNSYQPYGSTIRRPCVAPAELTSNSQDPQLVAASPLAGDHVTWCSNRYSSYRVRDNSYQPFSGGRKLCHSPVVRSAGNNIASQDGELSASIN